MLVYLHDIVTSGIHLNIHTIEFLSTKDTHRRYTVSVKGVFEIVSHVTEAIHSDEIQANERGTRQARELRILE